MSEFSVENLRFWDRATRYKAHYDRLSPADRDRIANELFSVFIKDDGAMSLNLSHDNRYTIIHAFPADQKAVVGILPVIVFISNPICS